MVVEKKIVIVKDSREPKEKYNFFHYKDVFHIGDHPLIDNLDVGDYSVGPYEKEFCIERKTLSDLIGSFSTPKKEKQEEGTPDHRQNFREMWERSEGYLQKFLMIEGAFADMIDQNYRSEFHPHSLLGSLMSWSIKYKFSWFFVSGEAEGQKAIYFLCKEFLRLKELKEKEKKNG